MNKKYNLLVTISYSHYGSGLMMVSHVFGPYNSLDECKEAGQEAKENYTSGMNYLSFTCIPV